VHDCLVNKVPFPALETFEDRKTFPKRYFLFFDVFVRAGRHNRDLWKKAIQENKGLNDKRFGPPIFEAHVRTTIRENYFKWIFQQLSDVHDIQDEDVAEGSRSRTARSRMANLNPHQRKKVTRTMMMMTMIATVLLTVLICH